MPPTSDEQIRFMVNIQRLLDEGLFTALNKFALLLALAVLSIEQGDDSGDPLKLTTDAIPEKYYWRQVVPYASAGEATILQQNTGRRAVIVNLVREARAGVMRSICVRQMGIDLTSLVSTGGAPLRLLHQAVPTNHRAHRQNFARLST